MPNVSSRFILYAIYSLFLSLPALAQKNKTDAVPFKCNVPELTPTERRALEAEAAFALQLKQSSGNKATGITYVPIRPHILRSSAGTGGLTLARMNYLLARTNRYYLLSGNGIQFYFCGTSPDYVDNDTYYPLYTELDEDAMANSRDAANAMNMYFINNAAENFAGYAYYPANARYTTRSVIVSTLSDERLGDGTMPHELGHNFNLIHTHGNGSSSTELVTRGAGANCSTAGDLLCDTPADPYGLPGFSTTTGPNGCPVYDGTSTDANGSAFTPPLTNLMSYYIPCRFEFTAGQYARIDGGLALRQTHTAYSLTCAPTNVNTPTNLIASSNASGVVLNWQDNASNEMGYFVERATSANGPFVPVGGVAPNATTFIDTKAPGNTIAYYRIRPSNSTIGGISTVASVLTPACRPSYSNGCTDSDGLNGFSLNAIPMSQNTGCASGISGYSQYTTVSPTVTPGSSYPFSATLLSTSYQEGVTIWADLNRNGVFGEAGEQLYQTPAMVSGSFTGNLTIPASVSAGSLPLRITVAYDIMPTDPCGSYSYGETEDYSLNVVAPTGCDALEPNDTYQTATLLPDGVNYTSPAICLNSTSDSDWFRWRTAGGAQTYYIQVHPYAFNSTGPYQLSLTVSGNLLTVRTVATSSGTSTDTFLKLFAGDGTTLLVQNDDYSGAFSRVVYALSGPQPCEPPLSLYLNSVNTSAANLGWSYTSGVQYGIRYRPVGTANWLTVNNITSSNYSLTGLTNNTTYEWQVQNVCSATNVSGYTTSSTFATGCYVPSFQYVDRVTSTSTYLYWTDAGVGVQYELNYRIAGASNWISINNLSNSNYTLTGLINNTNYEFRVRTLCGTGGLSGFTTPSTFRTNCEAPQYLNGSAASGTRANLYWSGVADGQTMYEVRYKSQYDATFTTQPGAVTSTYTSLSGLTPNTAYDFQVRTLCSDGQSSTFSSPASFTTIACQGTSSLYADNIGLQSVRLNWYANEPGIPVYPAYRAVGSSAWVYPFPNSTTATSYSLSGITPGTTYEWELYTQCPGSASNRSTSTGTPFTTLSCPIPTNLGLSSVGGTSVQLGWTVSQNGTPVEVQWRVANTTTWNSATTASGATSYALTGLTIQTTYEWRIRTICASTSSSSFAVGTNFTTSDLICRPTYLSGCTAGDALVSFSVNNELLSQNTGCSPGGYSSYTSLNTLIAPGATVPVSGNFAASYSEGVTIWADLNRNNQFEVTEKLYQTATSVTQLFSGNLTIPAGTATGSLRVRVMLVYNNATPNDACGTYNEGETEDYLITVGTPTNYNPRTQAITRTSALLRWNQLTAGLSYEVQWRVVGGTFATLNAGTSTTLTLADLAPGTAYEWQMRPVGTTAWNGPVSFTTVGCIAPTTFTAGSVSPTSVGLNWSSNSSNPTGTLYEIQYRPVSTTTWTTISGVSGTFYSLTGLTTNTVYQWQIRSVCSPGETSTYTVGTSFTTLGCTTPTPQLVGIGFSSATLRWFGPSNVQYEVQWQRQGNTSGWNSATTTITSLAISDLLVNVGYEWRVRSICSATESSTFSVPASFTTRCATPGFPFTSNINSYAAQLNWSTSGLNTSSDYIEKGAQYTVYWRQQGSSIWIPEPSTTGSAYVLTNLINATPYEWQVQTTCPTPSATVTSGFTTPLAFTTTCPAPSSVFVSLIGTTTATVGWSGQSSLGYQVQWRQQGSSAWTNSSPTLNEGASYLLTNLSEGTVYELRVQTLCPNGIGSIYSSTSSFTTTATLSCSAVPPTTYFSSVGAVQASLYWIAGNGLQIDLRWRAVGQTIWNMASRLETNGSASYSNYTLLGLQPGTSYEWQVGAICPGQTAVFGPLQSFTTTGCTTTTNLLNYCVQATGAIIQWNSQTGAPYDLQYGPVGGSTTIVSGLTTSSYSITGLTSGVPIQWQVRAVCSNTLSSSFSNPLSFTPTCLAPTGLSGASINTTDSCGFARILWAGCATGLAQYDVQFRRQGTSAWTPVGLVNGPRATLGGLLPATGYEYRINTQCGGGVSTSYSVGSFTTVTCRCEAVDPFNMNVRDITATSATLRWGTAFTLPTGTNTYQVRWKPGNSLVWNTTVVTGTQLRLSGLTNDTPYDWQVQSQCNSGQYSSYSQTNYFRTVCNPPLSLSASGIRSTSALLSWNGFGTGVTYDLQYRSQGNPNWFTISPVSSETRVVTGLTTNTTYEGRVATRCADGSVTDYTQPIAFRASCPEPTYLNVSSTNPNAALLNWRGDGGDSYEVQWRPLGSTSWTTVNVSSTVVSGSLYLTGLTGGTAYEWQVRTACGSGSFSNFPVAPLTFLTPPGGPPCTGAIVSVKNGAWDDPTVWSCNQVPTSSDPVTINHSVNLPPGLAGNALRISYNAGGKLIFGTGSKIRLGP